MKKSLKIVLLVVALIFIMFLFSWRNFFPLFKDLPRPSGKYDVANTYYHWENNYSTVNDKYKEFNVEAFYPAIKIDKNKQVVYQAKKIKAIKKVFAKEYHFPMFFMNQLINRAYTFTEIDLPIAFSSDKFPVIIYLPGIGSEALYNVYLEELASYGYVIFAIEPPYDILVSVFPEDKLIMLDPWLKKIVAQTNRTEIYKYRDQAHVRWTQYIISALQDINTLNNDPNSRFYQKLDLDKLGLIGHSHGGAVVTDFCQKNKICKAGVNMDGWTKTYNSSQAFDTPFLFLLSKDGGMEEMNDFFKNNQRENFKRVVVKDSNHGLFSDEILLNNHIFAFFFGAPIKNSEKIRKEIGFEIVSFFNKYLKDYASN